MQNFRGNLATQPGVRQAGSGFKVWGLESAFGVLALGLGRPTRLVMR